MPSRKRIDIDIDIAVTAGIGLQTGSTQGGGRSMKIIGVNIIAAATIIDHGIPILGTRGIDTSDRDIRERTATTRAVNFMRAVIEPRRKRTS